VVGRIGGMGAMDAGYDRGRLIDLLRREALRLGSFTLASGRTSHYYVDGRRVTLSAAGAALIGAGVLDLLDDLPGVTAVGGLTLGADPIGGATLAVAGARGREDLRGFLVRKEAKGHGTGQWIEGVKSLRPGMPVAIVEDVVTTGGSALKAIERARGFGLDVKLIVGLVDREEGGREALEAEAPLVTLFRKRDFA
jgi:orotate phosphoribosyltransferase